MNEREICKVLSEREWEDLAIALRLLIGTRFQAACHTRLRRDLQDEIRAADRDYEDAVDLYEKLLDESPCSGVWGKR